MYDQGAEPLSCPSATDTYYSRGSSHEDYDPHNHKRVQCLQLAAGNEHHPNACLRMSGLVNTQYFLVSPRNTHYFCPSDSWSTVLEGLMKRPSGLQTQPGCTLSVFCSRSRPVRRLHEASKFPPGGGGQGGENLTRLKVLIHNEILVSTR